MNETDTLTGILHQRLVQEPLAVACTLVDGDGSTSAITVRDLLGRSMAFAERFGKAGQERKIIGICLYHGVDLHAAFLGALWAGHIPTMLPPPSPRIEPTKYTQSFARMLEHIRPSQVVVDQPTLSKLEQLELSAFPNTELVSVKEVAKAAHVEPATVRPNDVALIQHSSGTTGQQKGIALSHRAILEHNRCYRAELGITRNDVIVTWLPLYHDMGFVACFLLPLLSGVPFVELSPFDWVLRPASLLSLIHTHRGTLCWLPNFAFSFMANSIRESDLPPDLDLSHVRAWVNCSEPVYHSSHVAFVERFGKFGVSFDQITASYAMAENVYAISQSRPREYQCLSVNRQRLQEAHEIVPDTGPNSVSFVSNGRLLPTTELSVIVDGRLVQEEDKVGELAIRGGHLFSGYFRREDLTTAAFQEGFYRTGDLGFVHDGCVYVTGRKKDLIIIQGRNFYPSDIEEAAMGVLGVAPGRVVAFGIPHPESGTEQLVVLLEVLESHRQEEKRVALRVRQRIAQELDCTASDVRPVASRWLVKSSSGKLARNDNRNKYLRMLEGLASPDVTD